MNNYLTDYEDAYRYCTNNVYTREINKIKARLLGVSVATIANGYKPTRQVHREIKGQSQLLIAMQRRIEERQRKQHAQLIHDEYKNTNKDY